MTDNELMSASALMVGDVIVDDDGDVGEVVFVKAHVPDLGPPSIQVAHEGIGGSTKEVWMEPGNQVQVVETVPRPWEEDIVTCGSCGLSWDDAIVTDITPAPSAHCPFEYFHQYDENDEPIEIQATSIPSDFQVQPVVIVTGREE